MTIKKTPLKVTFMGHSDAECIALAQLGQSDRVIKRDCKLTTGQIYYRLRKVKELMGHTTNYRSQWRNGEGEVVQRIKADILAVLRRDIQRTLPQRLTHPQPGEQS